VFETQYSYQLQFVKLLLLILNVSRVNLTTWGGALANQLLSDLARVPKVLEDVLKSDSVELTRIIANLHIILWNAKNLSTPENQEILGKLQENVLKVKIIFLKFF
jgi:hypothetical protein